MTSRSLSQGGEGGEGGEGGGGGGGGEGGRERAFQKITTFFVTTSKVGIYMDTKTKCLLPSLLLYHTYLSDFLVGSEDNEYHKYTHFTS